MDIGKLDIQETAEVRISFPGHGVLKAEDDTPCTVTIYGPASDQAVKADRAYKKGIVENAGNKRGKVNIPPDVIEELEVDRLTALTHSVHGITVNGAEVTAANIRQVYANPRYGWLRDQVAAASGGWEDFLS